MMNHMFFRIALMMSLFALNFQTRGQNLVEYIDSLYEKETIYLADGFYYKNDKVMKFGFLAKNIKQEIIDHNSEEAMVEFSLFKRKRIQGTIMSVFGSSMSIASLVFLEEIVISRPIIATMIIGAGFSLVGVIIVTKAYRHFLKSIWLHNKNIIKTGIREHQGPK